jgi:hypothetical protein
MIMHISHNITANSGIPDSTEWPRCVVDDKNFSIIHDVADKKLVSSEAEIIRHKTLTEDDRFFANDEMGRKSMVIASREGLNWLCKPLAFRPTFCGRP